MRSRGILALVAYLAACIQRPMPPTPPRPLPPFAVAVETFPPPQPNPGPPPPPPPFRLSSPEKWVAAFAYDSRVAGAETIALGPGPAVDYLNGMHERIHPIFAETFLEPLNSLPPNDPMNNQSLATRLEIVLTGEGHLTRMGVVRASGVTAFDIAALDSVERAQPFGPPPTAIVSSDGNVYLQWDFHRNEVIACTTRSTRIFRLR
jgi:TonB family protein